VLSEWVPGSPVWLKLEQIEPLETAFPDIYKIVRGLSGSGSRQLVPGFFEGSHARIASDSDVFDRESEREPAFQFAGFIEVLEHRTVIHLELIDHPGIREAVVNLYSSLSDRRISGSVTSLDGQNRRAFHY
jgi:hypothetical protein